MLHRFQVLFVLFGICFSLSLHAETAQSSLNTSVGKSSASVFDNIILGIKSYNDSGRFGELKDSKADPSKGRIIKAKQEFQVGYRFSEWGAYLQNSQTRSEYNDKELSKWVVGDPSLTVIHPDFYSDSSFKVGGSARAYFPMTDRSQSYDTRQFAYYLVSNYNLSTGKDIFNIAIPRWFVTNRYASTDTTFYIEDRTIYTQKFASWGRWGIGHWTQYELHADTSPGMTIDLVPQFDYLVSSKIFLGPRISLPIYVKNAVYDGDKNVSWENASFELYFQANL